MTELLPAPKSSSDSSGGASNAERRYRRNQGASTPIPNVDQILELLMQLNSAVVFGAISTTKANLIHRNLRTILDVQTKRVGQAETGAVPEALLEVCRRDPQVLTALEPFLADTQLDWLMDRIGDDKDESV